MKAAEISAVGGPEVLKINTDAPKPAITDDQVLVEVHAAGVNPFDIKYRSGVYGPAKYPATLGGDLSGIITKVGDRVTHVKTGDEVYGQAGAMSGHGSYAEFAPVPGTAIGVKPKNVSFIEAASLPLAGVSAYQALVDTIGLKSGQKILIHGGAGGIGSLAIQLAKHLGAQVATTVSAEDIPFVRSLGAEFVFDYKTQPFQDELKDYDAVFDTVGGTTLDKSYTVLRPGGILVTLAGQPSEEAAIHAQVTASSQATKLSHDRLTALTKLVEAGAIKPQVGKTFPLDQASEAHAYLSGGDHRGKVVLVVREG